MQTDPLSPEAGSSICSSLFPVRRGSGDNLWLPGLAGHLGVTLSDDQRARRGLTVQAEATDHVLQSCAFRFPLLQRERERERWKSFLSVSFRVNMDLLARSLWFELFTAHK